MKAKNKVLDRSKLLEELINMQKDHLDKTGLGFQLGEYSNQNDEDKRKEVKRQKMRRN